MPGIIPNSPCKVNSDRLKHETIRPSRRMVTMLRTQILSTICVLALAAASAAQKPAAQTEGTAAQQPEPAKVTGSAATQPSTPGAFQERYPRYHLGAGDSFDLHFEFSPEFDQTAVTVQPDGFITLQGIGDVHVAGKTVPELTEALRTAYSKILKDPQISVVLKVFDTPYFVVNGQVTKPGKYDLHGDVTVTQALAIAGGLTDAAKNTQVVLFRRVSDQWDEARVLDFKKMMKTHNLAEDLHLRAGDMLYVPKTRWSKVQQFIPHASIGSYLPLPTL